MRRLAKEDMSKGRRWKLQVCGEMLRKVKINEGSKNCYHGGEKCRKARKLEELIKMH